MNLKDPNVVSKSHPKRVAIVIANPAVSTTTQWPVGFWWSELTHPYFVLTEAGYEVEVFSPNGGKCEADGMSDPRDSSGYSANDLISMASSQRRNSPSSSTTPRRPRTSTLINSTPSSSPAAKPLCSPLKRRLISRRSSSNSMRRERSLALSATAQRSSSSPSSPTVSIS